MGSENYSAAMKDQSRDVAKQQPSINRFTGVLVSGASDTCGAATKIAPVGCIVRMVDQRKYWFCARCMSELYNKPDEGRD